MTKKIAVVTGASSGIGLEASKMLLLKGYLIYGIARDFSKSPLKNPDFVEISCDLRNTDDIVREINEIRKKHKEIHLLLNNAGIGYFGPHEELNPSKIVEMCNVNLISPLVITNLLLREIKNAKGFIINIASITARKESPMGLAYSATKAGLYHFGRGLFEETRKYGVKVVTICPDITKTNFFQKLTFCESDEPESYITPQCISRIIEMIIESRHGTVISDIEIRPQIHRIKKKSNI